MAGASTESELQVTTRRTLRAQLQMRMKVGGTILGMLIVLLVLGLILALAGDQSGVAAVEGMAGVAGIVLAAALVSVVYTLSQAVLLLLSEEADRNIQPHRPQRPADAAETPVREAG